MADYESIHGKRVNFLSSDPTLTSSYEGQVWYNPTSGTNKALVQIKAWAATGNVNTKRISAGGSGTTTAGITAGGRNGDASPQGDHQTEEYTGYTWRSDADMSNDRFETEMAGPTSAAVIVGGYDIALSPEKIANVEEYDGSTWTNGTAYPSAVFAGGAAGTQTAAVYFGGYFPPPTNLQASTKEYDGSSWTASGNMVEGRGYMASCGSQTSALAVCGKVSPSVDVEEYDGSSWTTGGNYPTSNVNAAASGLSTAAIVFSGALAPGGTAMSLSAAYDGTAFVTDASLATAREQASGSSQGTSQSAWVCLGNPTSPGLATEEYSSNINVETTGSWTAGGSMNLDRSTGNILGTSSTSALYVGGYRGPTPSPPTFQGQTAVESYNGTSWTNSNALPVAFYSGFSMGTTTAGLRAGGNKSTAQYGPDPISDESQEYNGSSWTAGGTLTQEQNLGASAGTQTAGLLWAGKGPSTTTPTTVTQEYDGSSFTTGGSVPSVRIRTMGAGIQTAAINFGGHPSTPNQDLNQSATYDGSSWTTGPNLNLARNAAMGAGTSTLAICGGGYMYAQPPGNTAATEWWDGTSWANIANNVVTGPRAFSGPGGTAATDCLAVEGPTGAQEWTGQPASTTTASTLTTS